MKKILVIDDDTDICLLLKRFLTKNGYTVELANNGKEGLALLDIFQPNLVMTDFRLGDINGGDLLVKIKQKHPHLPVIIITGYSDIKIAVTVMKQGAFDYVTKPLFPDEILITVRKALDSVSTVAPLPTEAASTEAQAAPKVYRSSSSPVGYIFGESQVAKNLIKQIDLVSPTNFSVIIYGESGAGKEAIAHEIHKRSKRRNQPFIPMDCGAISKELSGSELFGHEKGSFTSAIKQRIGKFEQANGGTIFLDEIGDMSPSAQAKVLRALQENKITRVGGEKEIDINVRVLAATNKDLLAEIDEGNFRMDLYHRLNVIHIQVPTLADRTSDIPLLANNFCKEICDDYGIPTKIFTDNAITTLQNLPWTGNIRELRNVIERLIILSEKTITEDDVKAYSNPIGSIHSSKNHPPETNSNDNFDNFNTFQEYKDYAEKEFIKFKLDKNAWNVSKTAEDIDIQRSHLYSKIEKFGLKRLD